MTAAVDLVNLTRTYPTASAPALKGVDLTVEPGQAVAVLGPSGSGKTTLLRLAAGLDAPDDGDIRLNGASVLHLPPQRRGIAMVSQRPLLFPHMSVLDNVAFGPRMAGAGRMQARNTATRYLELVELPGFGRRRTTELSGGQQQRIALARALAATPQVLLLDEPFSALDSELKSQMHQLLLELRAVLQPTIIMVTHDHHEAMLLADSVAIIIGGMLQQHGPAQSLFTHPQSLAVSRFLGGRNEISGEMRGRAFHCKLGVLRLADGTACAQGRAVMVIRQEAVRLVELTATDADTRGIITHAVAHGARTLVEVCAEGVPLQCEVPPGTPIHVGDHVGVALPVSQRQVLLDDPCPAPSRVGTPAVEHVH
ncbi:MAG: ABC transporter ATP-binding protein [Candidatus Nanopelagicales bacterium]|nr:ABC transporter ATP-binding protein [Candidatus Nanopelagicales bacterium]